MTIINPVAGDPSTELVATAEQSHVDGRVGPPTIAQDAEAEAFVPEGVDQVQPGAVLPADYPWHGVIDEGEDDAQGEVGDANSSLTSPNPDAKAAKRAS
jgi:hypothetical protein